MKSPWPTLPNEIPMASEDLGNCFDSRNGHPVGGKRGVTPLGETHLMVNNG